MCFDPFRQRKPDGCVRTFKSEKNFETVQDAWLWERNDFHYDAPRFSRVDNGLTQNPRTEL